MFSKLMVVQLYISPYSSIPPDIAFIILEYAGTVRFGKRSISFII